MIATGVAFAVVHDYALLLVVAFAGTINPVGGQRQRVRAAGACGAERARCPIAERTRMFARYSLIGALARAFGALAAALAAVSVGRWASTS